MSEHKTDYFGSFLAAMKADPAMGSTMARAFAGSQPLPQPGVADAVLHALLERSGRAEAKDLLPGTGYSVDGLAAALATLASFNLIKQEPGFMVLTPEGRAAALARSAA